MESSKPDDIFANNISFVKEYEKRADTLLRGAIFDIADDARRRCITPADAIEEYGDVIGGVREFALFCKIYAALTSKFAVSELSDIFFSSETKETPKLVMPDLPPLKNTIDRLSENGYAFSVSYADSFSEALEAVQYGDFDLTLLPYEKDGKSLSSFSDMRKNSGLKINAAIDFDDGESGFVLVSPAFNDVASKFGFDRLAVSADVGEPFSLIGGSVLLGASPINVSINGTKLTAELDISRFNDLSELRPLVLFLSAHDVLFDGIYPCIQISQKE